MARASELDKVTAGAQIKRFLILHKELDADDGELTRTQKVRRGFIAERWGWQAGFGAVGVPGLVLALVFLLIVRDYKTVADVTLNFTMKRVFSKSDIFPVFHQLFAKNQKVA